MIVVSTDDAVMITPKKRTSEIKDLVLKLSQEGRSEAEHHPCVHRPWERISMLT